MLLRGRQLEILTSARPGFFPDSASCELPLLTPCSKAVMSQALKATFSGFKKEQRRLGIPKSKCLRRAADRGLRRAGRASLAALARDGCILSPCVRRLPKSGRDGGKLSQLLFQPHQLDTVARVLEFTWGVSLRLLVFGGRGGKIRSDFSGLTASFHFPLCAPSSSPQTPGCGRSSRCASGCSGPPTSSAW